MESGKVFEKQKLPVGAHRIFSADGFSLRVSREKEGWMINHTERSVNQGEPYDFTGGEYFQTGKSATLIVLPALPAKPLVFKGNSIHVVPGQKFSFYLKIPLSGQLYYAKNLPSNLMKEMPARRLSDTWFGDAYGGEPAFALGNEFYRNSDEAKPTLFEALCPVTIYNNSPG